MADVSATAFFRSPFESLAGPKQLTEYTIINVEPVGPLHLGAGHGHVSTKVPLSLATLMFQESDEGRGLDFCKQRHSWPGTVGGDRKQTTTL